MLIRKVYFEIPMRSSTPRFVKILENSMNGKTAGRMFFHQISIPFEAAVTKRSGLDRMRTTSKTIKDDIKMCVFLMTRVPFN